MTTMIRTATLLLQDGTRFSGQAFGAEAPCVGDVVFATDMIGYQLLLTDPAYRGQILCMTYPLIGNVGINGEDMASGGAQIAGLVVQSLCDLPSNWLCKRSLPDFLIEQGVPALQGIDTRALARHIRDTGVQRGRICMGEPTQADLDALAVQAKRDSCGGDSCDLVAQVTCKEAYRLPGEGPRVAVLDLGAEKPLLAALQALGCSATVYPAATSAAEMLDGCDGVLISGGPGDPATQAGLLDTVRALMQGKPTFGVGLGLELMVLAQGGGIIRLKHGHHGGQPVRESDTGCCAQTAQRHRYAPDPQRLPQGARITHTNLNDQSIAGLAFGEGGARGVIFHPSAQSRELIAFVSGLSKG